MIAGRSKKIPFWASVFTIFSVLILCSLGTWQIQRLAWKTNLLTKIEAAQTIDPQNHEFHVGDLTSQAEWQRGFVRGTYKNDLAIQIAPRTEDGKVGYHLIVPLALDSGGTVLVNRGWFAQEDFSLRRASTLRGDSTGIKIAGTLRLPEIPNRFVPLNEPAKNQWYSVDLDSIKTVEGLNDLAPVVLYAESETPSFSPAPHYIRAAASLPNNHLQYALFWFGMAVVLLVVYFVRFIVQDKLRLPL